MSRYIRTKDRIIDLNKTYLDGSPIYNLDTKENVIKANENGEERDCYYIENDTIYMYWYSDGCIWDEHIISQSDKPEELFDVYVGISKESKPMIIKYEFDEYYDEYNDSYTKEELMEVYDEIRGAIWTDKGLKYIAKMNSKGDFKLWD